MTDTEWWRTVITWASWVVAPLLTAIAGLVAYIWKGHSSRISKLEKDVSDMQMSVVTVQALNDKAKEMRDSVKDDHEEILRAVRDSNESVAIQLNQLRTFLFNHLNDGKR